MRINYQSLAFKFEVMIAAYCLGGITALGYAAISLAIMTLVTA